MLIAQLSDLHIRPEGDLYKGVVDSNRLLVQTIAHLKGLDKRPDLVVITGDLVDKGDRQEYAMAARLLGDLGIPFLLIPGNHDNRDEIRFAFPSHNYMPNVGAINYVVNSHTVRIIGLDTTVPGMHHGETPFDTLNWLNDSLSEDTEKPTLIIMHHPPFICGIPYMDEYRCFDSDELNEVIGRYFNVEAVLCGHVHRPMIRRFAGTLAIACPSTATEIDLQFKSDANPQSYLGPHGYMLHLWSKEHGLVSHLCNVDKQSGPYPFY